MMQQPTLVGLDQETVDKQRDKLDLWFGNIVMAQTMHHELLKDVTPKVKTPEIKAEMQRFTELAASHKSKAMDLFRHIDREPKDIRTMGSGIMASARQAMTDFEGAMGGAPEPWRDLQQLFLTSLKSTGAWGTSMQLGNAVGVPAIAHTALPVMREKFLEHRWLQETLMERSALAILENREF